MIINKYPIGYDGNGHRVYEERPLNCKLLLSCDECRTPICWAYDGDLNGSYFQCFDCKAKDLLNV